MEKVMYSGIYPIGDTDPLNMPVPRVEKASAWYVQKMGFAIATQDETGRRVVVRRDDVEIGLAENGGDPEQASCYVAVSDSTAARDELLNAGVNVSELRVDEWGGVKRRVFFAKDDDGLCYCLGTEIDG